MECGTQIVDLATPERQRHGRPTHLRACPGTGSPSALACLGESGSEDAEVTPRLPDGWLPLEYELLEYADSLPRGFATQVSCELEAQERRVAELRATNASLKAAGQSHRAKAAVAAATRKPRHQQSPPMRTVAPKFSSSTDSGEAQSQASSQKDDWRAALAETVRQLEEKVRQVRAHTDQELLELGRRTRAAEEEQRRLSREAAEDVAERKRLWEAEAELLRLRCRVQQLEVAKSYAEQKAGKRETQEREVVEEMQRMKSEAEKLRARLPEFDGLDRQEEELRRALREAKASARTVARERLPGGGHSGTVAAGRSGIVRSESVRNVATPSRTAGAGRC